MDNEALAVKQELMTAVTLKRELEALDAEWHDLLAVLEEQGDSAEFAVAESVNRQRIAARRALTECRLRNWARICAGDLTPLQRRILGLRYVRGCTWSDLIAQIKKAKQYLLREHNKALVKLVESELRTLEKKSPK